MLLVNDAVYLDLHRPLLDELRPQTYSEKRTHHLQGWNQRHHRASEYVSDVLHSTTPGNYAHIRICLDEVVSGRAHLWIGGHCVSRFRPNQSYSGGNAITPALRGTTVNDKSRFLGKEWSSVEPAYEARSMAI